MVTQPCRETRREIEFEKLNLILCPSIRAASGDATAVLAIAATQGTFGASCERGLDRRVVAA